MVIRQTPKNPQDFIITNNKQGKELQENGFMPLYMDMKNLYFKKTKELLEFMKGGEVIGEK